MKFRNTIFYLISLLIIVLTFSNCQNNKESGILVRFPEISKLIPITSGPKEHLFASYYGINSWSANQK